MNLSRPFQALFVPAILAAAVGSASAQLAPASPFLPAASSDQAASQDGPLELRGIMTTAEGARFCIYDTAKKASTWVAQNEAGNDFVVTAHDPNSDTATLEAHGRTVTLSLRQVKVTGGAGPGPAGMPAGAVNSPPADEARRLESVSAEIQRRRLLREQAGGRQLPAPPPVEPPPGMGRPGH